MSRENHLYYKPTPEGLEKIERLRAAVIVLDDLIDELLKPTVHKNGITTDFIPTATTRSAAIAKTKLEECRMRAIEAIVRLHSDVPVT